jgi:hypothetical protein
MRTYVSETMKTLPQSVRALVMNRKTNHFVISTRAVLRPNLRLSFSQTPVPRVDFTLRFVHQVAEMLRGAVQFCTYTTNCARTSLKC